MIAHRVFVVQLLVFSTTGQLLKNIPPDFQPILSKIIAQREKVKIAKATDSLQVEGHKAIARVIKHTDTDSPVARTVIIQNSPEAHKAFGVRNIPKKILKKFQKKNVVGTSTPTSIEKLVAKKNNIVRGKHEDKGKKIKDNPFDFKLENTSTTVVTSSTNNPKIQDVSKNLQTLTTFENKAPTTTQITPRGITEYSQSDNHSETTIFRGTKEQSTENTVTNIPRIIRSYESTKNIVSKHATETTKRHQERYKVSDKPAHDDDRYTSDKSVTIYVLKNPTVENQVSIEDDARISLKQGPKTAIYTAPVNPISSLRMSSNHKTAKSSKQDAYPLPENVKSKKKRHVQSHRQSRRKFVPTRKFFYGFQPISQPRYHVQAVRTYFQRY